VDPTVREEKFLNLLTNEPWPLACNQTLYQLSYPSPYIMLMRGTYIVTPCPCTNINNMYRVRGGRASHIDLSTNWSK